MQYRTLGQTDLKISVISVGYWAVADSTMWGSQDEQTAFDAVHTALDLGINLFDTAEGYGDGYSETMLGKALGERRHEAIIASKVRSSNLAPDKLIQACETSLRRLGTDTIDIYQIHWPSRTVPFEDSMAALEKLRDQGKIRVISVSNFGVRDLNTMLSIGRVESNQLPYSLLFRAIEYEILPMCREHAISVLTYSPLLQGLLTGKFATPADVPDQRTRTRHFSGKRAMARHDGPGAEHEVFTALDRIRRISASLTLPMAQVSLAWLLHQPGITSVIAGARNPEQVRQNALAADITLPPEIVAELGRATDTVKATLGPDPDMWQSAANSRFR